MIRKLLLLLTFSSALLLPAEQLVTVAVEPFTARGSGTPADADGAKLAAEFALKLKERGIYPAVEQHPILAKPRVLVTGSYFSYGQKNFIVLKAASAESGEVLAAAVNGEKLLDSMLPELADSLVAQIKEETNFLPPPLTALSAAAGISGKVQGAHRKIYLSFSGKETAPALRELAGMLSALGFRLTSSRAEAELQLIGGGAPFPNELTGATAAVTMTLIRDGKPAGAVQSVASFTGEKALQEAFVSAVLSAASELLLKNAK